MKNKSAVATLAAVFLGSTFALADSSEPKSYPLSKCVVSGEKLGEHGKPVKVTSEGTDVYLCCKSCLKDFNKDPKKFVTSVKNVSAEAIQKSSAVVKTPKVVFLARSLAL